MVDGESCRVRGESNLQGPLFTQQFHVSTTVSVNHRLRDRIKCTNPKGAAQLLNALRNLTVYMVFGNKKLKA